MICHRCGGECVRTGHAQKYCAECRIIVRRIQGNAVMKRNRSEKPEYREKGRAYSRQWRAKNPEKNREAARRWKAENPEKCREHKRRAYAKNPEKHLERNRRWREANPEQHRAEYMRMRLLANIARRLLAETGTTIPQENDNASPPIS